MNCDYWTLMSQPRWFIDLFEMYISIEGKVKAEENKKMQSEVNRIKSKAGGLGRGR